MRRATHLMLFLSGLLVLAATGCTSIQDLVESGNYEESIAIAQRRLSGKEKKNPKLVAALEQAVNRANDEDVRRAAYLSGSGNPDWVRIHAIYDNLKRRQDALRPLLPLYDKHGRKANFRFVKVEGLVTSTAARAADQLYGQASDLLAAGRRGDKAAARDAYHTFERIEGYQRDYRDAYALATEAEQLGRVYITVEVINQSGGYLPAGFERELLRLSTTDLDDHWRIFDFERRSDRSYDYRASIVIRDIAVSPERLSERSYVDEREITDGEEYVLDENGNVAKDTLGNDITQVRKVIVRAEVLEVLQQKTALVRGSMQFYDLRRQRLVDEEDLTAETTFEHYASTFRGDRRALTDDSRRRIGNQPRPFPSDENLILDAVSLLKPQLTDRLARSHRLI